MPSLPPSKPTHQHRADVGMLLANLIVTDLPPVGLCSKLSSSPDEWPVSPPHSRAKIQVPAAISVLRARAARNHYFRCRLFRSFCRARFESQVIKSMHRTTAVSHHFQPVISRTPSSVSRSSSPSLASIVSRSDNAVSTSSRSSGLTLSPPPSTAPSKFISIWRS